MDYSSITLLSLAKTKMSYLAENQDVIAQNIANADTPGYKPKQLVKLDFERLALAEAHRLEVRATSPGHIGGTSPTQEFRSETQRKTYETTPVKNAIAIEEQMALMADNKGQYDTVTNLYRKTAGLFRIAVVGNR
ncbi:MAG: flagellar basal body protein [Rickettsiales bacterium]|nr:flagellar basal body protein [Rickettsiales bacterium]